MSRSQEVLAKIMLQKILFELWLITFILANNLVLLLLILQQTYCRVLNYFSLENYNSGVKPDSKKKWSGVLLIFQS